MHMQEPLFALTTMAESEIFRTIREPVCLGVSIHTDLSENELFTRVLNRAIITAGMTAYAWEPLLPGYSELGQPLVLPGEQLTRHLESVGAAPIISFTHENGLHMAGAAISPLRGIGVDLVRLSRVKREGERMWSMARKFMSENEYQSFRQLAENETHSARSARFAAHFSLMESASKALGAGLMLGLGIGRSGSLPCRDIHVNSLKPGAHMELTGKAKNRFDQLGAVTLKGFSFKQREYLLSVALLS